MDIKSCRKIASKIFSLAIISFFVVSLLLISIIFVTGKIPSVEGTDIVVEGEAYHFNIGMTKQSAFELIKKHYSKDEYILRVLWLRESELNKLLQKFENTEMAKYKNRKYCEYKILVKNLNNLTLPLELVGRWDIEMPASWVNSIHLQFEDGRMKEIRKEKYLFERP